MIEIYMLRELIVLTTTEGKIASPGDFVCLPYDSLTMRHNQHGLLNRNVGLIVSRSHKLSRDAVVDVLWSQSVRS